MHLSGVDWIADTKDQLATEIEETFFSMGLPLGVICYQRANGETAKQKTIRPHKSDNKMSLQKPVGPKQLASPSVFEGMFDGGILKNVGNL